ncbi:hypothetical protein [Candidatus Bodocaedibacter vickermanii]|uniref:Uncharacterized protein n=1 Tax=Candidatus Bodocaedibacter vickermanii TaxID=2741701 RepID=A0A7L9RU34_9PROT|nr:hypothetical protein CPBP_00911 [Candidatus Paracaedibacteraceae bacterium 'Lake Konstanz']
MQFSILGVPFKCTKDMFTWEKAKWSLFVYWAQLWRGVLLLSGALLLLVGIFFLPGVINSNELSALYQGVDPSIMFLVPVVYASQYWYQHLLVLGIVLWSLWCVGLILGMIYFQYYTLFKKNYQTLSRQLNKFEIRSLWSWGFWKPFIFITVFGLLAGGVVRALFWVMDIQQGGVALISLIIGVVLFHIFLHGGTWGFAPVSKQHPATK